VSPLQAISTLEADVAREIARRKRFGL